MSATATDSAVGQPGSGPTSAVIVHDVTLRRNLTSEWIKFSSLRSTWITLAAALVGTVGFGALASWGTNSRWSHMDPSEIAQFSAVSRSLVGVNLAQLAVAVLAVLFVSGEYATGMIRATLAATPTRWPVLVAKLVVLSAVMFTLSLVAAFAAFLLGQSLLGAHGVGIGAPHAVRAIVGVALYLTVVAALSLGVGFALRSTAGGIATVFGILLVIPGLGNALPSSWQPHVLPYLPSNAGSGLFTLHPDPGSLAPWPGFVVMVLWAAAALLLGGWVLRRRDA